MTVAPSARFEYDVAVMGGCGHVGLPLALVLAESGLRTVAFDIAQETVSLVNSGSMPFKEEGAEAALKRCLGNGSFQAAIEPSVLSKVETVIVVIGTPIDEHLNPEPMAVLLAIQEIAHQLVDGQLLVLRSTVFPGVTALVEEFITGTGRDIDVAFCPERIAQGRAMSELRSLPQIVSARSDRAVKRAEVFFQRLTPSTVVVAPEEAELAKLLTNTWRYVKFATANQFFMIVNDFGLDYERVRHAIVTDYPRAADLPGAGFAAGPCLLKDTMQLAAFNNNNFTLGQSAMMINEGLPHYVVSRIEQSHSLRSLTVGILGMAFKAESDDTRSSLSYKLKRILEFRAARVLCTDPFVKADANLVPLSQVLDEADLLIIGVPHSEYRGLDVAIPVVDIWNATGRGARV